MAKNLRMTEDQLRAQVKRPGYGASVVAHQVVRTAQKAQNAVAKAALDPTPENRLKAARALLVSAAAAGQPEAIFRLQLEDESWPALCQPEFQHDPEIKGRKFRLDVAFPYRLGEKVGFEVQGHVHRIKQQFLRDMERHNLLTEAGWKIYYVSGDMVRDGRALALVKRLIRTGGAY